MNWKPALCAMIVVTIGCNTQTKTDICPVCPPTPICPADVNLSGAYALELTVDTTSKYNGCSRMTDNLKTVYCPDSSIAMYDGWAPRRLYVIDKGDHVASIGLDDACSGKVFDKHLVAHCVKEDDVEDTNTWYDLTIDHNQVSGTIKFYHSWSKKFSLYGEHFTREYIVSGSRMK